MAARVLVALVVWRVAAPAFGHDVAHYRRATPFTAHHMPYRDVLWEYPPLTLLPVFIAQLFGSWFPAAFIGLMIGCEYASLGLLRTEFPADRRRIAFWWYLTILPISLVGWFRLDYMVVLLATIAVLATLRSRPTALWVTLGFATKLWPVLMIVGTFTRRRWRDVAATIAGCLGVVGVWIAFSPHGFESFLRFRRAGGLQIESVLGSLRLAAGAHPRVAFGAWTVGDGGWRWVDPAGVGLLVAAGLTVVVLARRRAVDPVLVSGGLVTLSMLCGRILSPQYLTWLGPFVIVGMIRGSRRVGPLFAASVWLTLAYWSRYDRLVDAARLIAASVIVRNIVLAVLMTEFFVAAFANRRPSGDEFHRPLIAAERS